MFKAHLLDGMIVLVSMPMEVEPRWETMISMGVWCNSYIWRDAGCLQWDELWAGQLPGQAAADSGDDRLMMPYTPEHMLLIRAQHRYQGVKEKSKHLVSN